MHRIENLRKVFSTAANGNVEFRRKIGELSKADQNTYSKEDLIKILYDYNSVVMQSLIKLEEAIIDVVEKKE